jgi:hypothetical protein
MKLGCHPLVVQYIFTHKAHRTTKNKYIKNTKYIEKKPSLLLQYKNIWGAHGEVEYQFNVVPNGLVHSSGSGDGKGLQDRFVEEVWDEVCGG